MTVALLTARDGLDRRDFVDYYENHHAPFILSFPLRPLRYSRRYLPDRSERRFSADFDVVTQMAFADEQSYRAWLGVVLAEGSGVAEDEARFLDRSRTRSWSVEVHGDAMPGEDGIEPGAAVLLRPESGPPTLAG
ncbi:EthD domain-containing protein [Luteimicrobium sp. NPDC057192]|uniref:EthD domain-containing protein n=1 Tax=Luteimicrobium sp. NPDC057192 TaxID=3346042 RepID=UPI00362845A0